MKPFSVIVATAQNGGIGKDGSLPWHIKEDLAHFRRVTTAVSDAGGGKANAVVMGRRTWQSIPEKLRPLANRVNVVLTKDMSAAEKPEGAELASSVQAAVDQLSQREDVGEIFIIGGHSAYQEALSLPNCSRIFITRVGTEVDCDTFFPAFDAREFQVVHVGKTQSHKDIPFDFIIYERSEASTQEPFCPSIASVGGRGKFLHEEYQYLDAIREIMENGVAMEDRTGVGTLSVFGRQMRFDLRRTFPLLTTKRTFWRGVVEELLWFVKGDTNAKHLSEKGVKIWDANGSREFLDKRGLSHREEGDLGPVYGFQWRHFGAKYVDMHTDYSGQGVDQLAECIRKIKEDPTDRRILLSAWNPADLGQMALPPCHMFCQFYVANGELSCLMYQRSCDMGLGVPFNIASYSLLTVMVAQVCGLRPGDFVHTLGNSHVYKNHVDPLKTQLERTPRPFPVLRVNPDVKDIDGFSASDFELLGYNPHGKIAMEMAV